MYVLIQFSSVFTLVVLGLIPFVVSFIQTKKLFLNVPPFLFYLIFSIFSV